MTIMNPDKTNEFYKVLDSFIFWIKEIFSLYPLIVISIIIVFHALLFLIIYFFFRRRRGLKELSIQEKGEADSLGTRLSKTRNLLFTKFQNIFSGAVDINEERFERLEEALYVSDIGVKTTQEIINELRETHKKTPFISFEQMEEMIRSNILSILSKTVNPGIDLSKKPTVILVAGVNGTGKTTTIGKLAMYYTGKGLKVLLAAGDTFRAAASEQLTIWAERSGAELFRGEHGASPSGVIYDAINMALSKVCDIIIIDRQHL